MMKSSITFLHTQTENGPPKKIPGDQTSRYTSLLHGIMERSANMEIPNRLMISKKLNPSFLTGLMQRLTNPEQRAIPTLFLLLLFVMSSGSLFAKDTTHIPATATNITAVDANPATRTPETASTAVVLSAPAEIIKAPVAANTDMPAIIRNQAIAEKMIRLNPRAVSFVKDYMSKHTKGLLGLRDWGLPYFNLMDQVLIEHDLPVELKYLAVVESRLQKSALSYAGAVGPWQFMASTARAYGLKVTKGKDERRDYAKSTHAAARYLKDLYAEFGDWLLVIAAYNGGPTYVQNAIKKSRSRNFWKLQQFLPAESRDHVKKFISTHYIFEGRGGICTLTKDEATEQIGSLAGYLHNRNLTAEELNKASTTTISGKYRAVVIAKYVNMDIQEFNRYNPRFDVVMDSEQIDYELKLPGDHMEKFVANKYPILNESVQLLLSNTSAMAEVPKEEQGTASNTK